MGSSESYAFAPKTGEGERYANFLEKAITTGDFATYGCKSTKDYFAARGGNLPDLQAAYNSLTPEQKTSFKNQIASVMQTWGLGPFGQYTTAAILLDTLGSKDLLSNFANHILINGTRTAVGNIPGEPLKTKGKPWEISLMSEEVQKALKFLKDIPQKIENMEHNPGHVSSHQVAQIPPTQQPEAQKTETTQSNIPPSPAQPALEFSSAPLSEAASAPNPLEQKISQVQQPANPAAQTEIVQPSAPPIAAISAPPSEAVRVPSPEPAVPLSQAPETPAQQSAPQSTQAPADQALKNPAPSPEIIQAPPAQVPGTKPAEIPAQAQAAQVAQQAQAFDEGALGRYAPYMRNAPGFLYFVHLPTDEVFNYDMANAVMALSTSEHSNRDNAMNALLNGQRADGFIERSFAPSDRYNANNLRDNSSMGLIRLGDQAEALNAMNSYLSSVGEFDNPELRDHVITARDRLYTALEKWQRTKELPIDGKTVQTYIMGGSGDYAGAVSSENVARLCIAKYNYGASKASESIKSEAKQDLLNLMALVWDGKSFTEGLTTSGTRNPDYAGDVAPLITLAVDAMNGFNDPDFKDFASRQGNAENVKDFLAAALLNFKNQGSDRSHFYYPEAGRLQEFASTFYEAAAVLGNPDLMQYAAEQRAEIDKEQNGKDDYGGSSITSSMRMLAARKQNHYKLSPET